MAISTLVPSRDDTSSTGASPPSQRQPAAPATPSSGNAPASTISTRRSRAARNKRESCARVLILAWPCGDGLRARSEEQTSELQSLMRISYAVFCLKKKKENQHNTSTQTRDHTT